MFQSGPKGTSVAAYVTSEAIDGNKQALHVIDAGATANGVLIGAVNETAPATDTAPSGLNGRIQRIAQRITSLIALVPAALGRLAAASSFAVVFSTEDFNELKRATAGTKASVGDAAASTTLLAANAARKSVTIVNDSTAILYVDATGGTASSTSYTHYLPGTGGGTPASLTINDFTGLITGIWASDAGGNARVSEYT